MDSNVNELIETANKYAQSNRARTSDMNLNVYTSSSKNITKEYVITSGVVIFFYSLFGAIMYFIEEPVEQAAIQTNNNKRQCVLQMKRNLTIEHLNMSDEEFIRKLDNLLLFSSDQGERDDHIERRWTLIRSISFAIETMTTIGFGYTTPSTNMGKILTIIFGVTCIPINIQHLIIAGKGKENLISRRRILFS